MRTWRNLGFSCRHALHWMMIPDSTSDFEIQLLVILGYVERPSSTYAVPIAFHPSSQGGHFHCLMLAAKAPDIKCGANFKGCY